MSDVKPKGEEKRPRLLIVMMRGRNQGKSYQQKLVELIQREIQQQKQQEARLHYQIQHQLLKIRSQSKGRSLTLQQPIRLIPDHRNHSRKPWPRRRHLPKSRETD